jgi:hypothetical protein
MAQVNQGIPEHNRNPAQAGKWRRCLALQATGSGVSRN